MFRRGRVCLVVGRRRAVVLIRVRSPDPQRATPPWCEQVPERCALYEGVPSRQIAVWADEARGFSPAATNRTTAKMNVRIEVDSWVRKVFREVRHNADSSWTVAAG